MIARYTRPQMGDLWNLKNKYQTWLDVEISVCQVLSEEGEIPAEVLKVIQDKAGFDVQRIDEIEKEVKHDVIAFLTSVSEHVGPEARYIHKGLTSSDVLDTALALLMKKASEIIIEDIDALMKVLHSQALRYKETPQIGRSHGVHAEPMVFGLKFSLWYAEMKRNRERMERAKEVISVGKLSGAVGTFSNISPETEEKICKKLGLTPEPVATQVVQRDRHAEFMNTLALIAASIEKIAIEIRHLQRTEVREAEEPFSKGQKGSSAMPHKRNPVGCENLTGLARIVRSNALAAMENIALWHERDISHSSVERVIIPDSTILINYMLNRLRGILERLHVYPEHMEENLRRSFGLFNSQRVLITLTEKGLTREKAYEITQKNAMKSWQEKRSFKDILSEDQEVIDLISKEELDSIFKVENFFNHIDFIYDRVFNKKA